MLRAVVLLSIPAALLACTPTPGGQPVQKMFLVQGVTELPLEFAYSTKPLANYPKFARTPQEAMKTIRAYVRKSVRKVIRKVVQEAGHPEADQQTVAQQVTPTIFEYQPLNCVDAVESTAGAPNADNTCLVNTDAIQQVAFLPNQKLPIAPNYRLFFVDLAIRNLQISQLSRDQWVRLLARVKTELATGTYRRFFQNASIKFLG